MALFFPTEKSSSASPFISAASGTNRTLKSFFSVPAASIANSATLLIQRSSRESSPSSSVSNVSRLRNTSGTSTGTGRRQSQASILAAKMAESGHQSTPGWPNNVDDYEVGEIIGISSRIINNRKVFNFFIFAHIKKRYRRDRNRACCILQA